MPATPSFDEINKGTEQTNYSALGTLVTVFFFWGFIAAGNNIFIPFCKNYFSLDQFQSQLIDFAFYTAYFMGSFLLFTISIWKKEDLIGKWGYRSSIIRGLLFSTIGAGVMILSVKMDLYAVMLIGLFILALGFSLQQIAANPFALQLGPPESGNSRINFGGAINSIGTMLGPILLAFALYGSTEIITDEMISSLKLDKVILLYALVGSLFIIAAALFYFSKKIVDFKRDFEIIDAKKSWISLAFMTLLVALFFSFIFATYNESSTIVEKEKFRLFFLILSITVIVGTLSFAGYRAKKNEIG
jgi:FHS family L-fucose permease-like MFS transporter